jgi:hypothetical protein
MGISGGLYPTKMNDYGAMDKSVIGVKLDRCEKFGTHSGVVHAVHYVSNELASRVQEVVLCTSVFAAALRVQDRSGCEPSSDSGWRQDFLVRVSASYIHFCLTSV